MEKKKKSVFKIPCLVIFTIFISLSAYPVFAETKTFIKEYTYQASEADSKLSSRTVSLREVKRLLLEELGTYLESITEVKNFHLTKDQIVTLTAGIVSTEVVEEKWDGKVYWLKAKISADPQDVIKSIDTLRKNREKVQELEEVRKRSEGLLRENERLKRELAAKKGTRKETTQAYKKNIENLTAAEWFEKGYALGTSNNYTGAVEAFTKVIELNPKLTEAYNNRGVAYSNLGNQQQAIKDFDKAIKLDPRDALAYNNRGAAYAALGNRQQAIKDYNKAIELDPQCVEAYYNRGIAYGRLGNYQQSIKDCARAIELNPQYALAYNNRGGTYSKLGNQQQAIKDFDKAIELDPQCVEAYHNRGAAYAALGNYQQALKDYNKAIELKPQDADAYVLRGITYGRLGNYQQEINDYKIAARLGDKFAQDSLRKQGIDW